MDDARHVHVYKLEKAEIADPGSLGLASFALTTFVLSAHNAGWAPDLIWISFALFYGGVAQFAAGMWEFQKNNTFGATAFTTYGAFWISLGIFIVFELTGVIPATFNTLQALGWVMSGFFIFTFYMAICALMLSKAVFAVFFLLDITFACLFIGYFSNQEAVLYTSSNWICAAGYFGLFTAIAAWYASFAITFNATARKGVIPVGASFLAFENDNIGASSRRDATTSPLSMANTAPHPDSKFSV